MIGVALFMYKRWEVSNQRKYEDRTTLAFQRAGYVKDLVPMVVDSERALPARSPSADCSHRDWIGWRQECALALTEILLR